MKSNNWRLILGAILLVFGIMMLLQELQIIPPGSSLVSIFFGCALLLGGLAFLTLLSGGRSNWWALIPGITLVDLGGLTVLNVLFPTLGDRFGGIFFMAGLSLAFWAVYLVTPQNWWAIIPGGVLLTLAAVIAVEEITFLEGGGIFFIGLALTFGLLGILPVEGRRMNWPWIPAGILLLFGIMVSLSVAKLANYAWAAGLILAGLFFLVRAFRKE